MSVQLCSSHELMKEIRWRGPLDWSWKSNMAAWLVPRHEASFSNKCLTKFGLKGWHFVGMTNIFFSLSCVRHLKINQNGAKYLPGIFLCGVEGSSQVQPDCLCVVIRWPVWTATSEIQQTLVEFSTSIAIIHICYASTVFKYLDNNHLSL